MSSRTNFLKAAASQALQNVTGLNFTAAVNLTAGVAAADGQAKKLPTFKIAAYSGVPMQVAMSYYPVVVDLSGLKAAGSEIPVLLDHDATQIVGQANEIKIDGSGVTIGGTVMGEDAPAQKVTALAKNGFNWKASIGASVDRRELLDAGKTATVNGKQVTGPMIIARQSTLREVSFVSIGADSNTSAAVAAKYGDTDMKFEQWLAAKGFDIATLTDQQKASLQASYDAEQKKPEPVAPVAPATSIAAGGTVTSGPVADPVLTLRANLATETTRVADVTLIAKDHPAILAKAIGEGWDKTKTELEVLRASRAHAPAGIVRANGATSEVLEAALCMGRNLPNVEKQFKPETLEAASRHRNLGIQELLLIAAAGNGYSSGPGMRISGGNIREVLEYAFPLRASGASTLSIPGILSNVANKEILAGYMEEDQTWRDISVVKSVNDFKQVTSYRMLDNMEYEELPPNGEIKMGSVDQESYTRQAKTYAKMFGLDRSDIINDDMGALDDLRARIGRGSAKKLNSVFWTKFLANSSFFTTARANYITGSTTTLLVDGVGLQAAILAFNQLKTSTADGAKRVGGRPAILLVPPELEFAAQRIYQSTTVNTGGSSTAESVGNANIHAGKYKPVMCPWLSDSNFTGYSSTAWYLLRLPTDMAAIVVSFLNGVQTPTVESAQADFDRLGIQFRGYHDFGVDFAEYLCGIKSKGAA